MKNIADTQPLNIIGLLDEADRKRARRRRAAKYTAVPIAALGAVGIAFGAAGIANAGTLPTSGPTIAMTIHNNTGQDMILQGSDNPYGQWIQGPNAVLAPWSGEIITATNSDPSGIGVDVTYSLPGNAQAVFMANNYGNGANNDGTRMTGGDGHFYNIDSTVDTGFPTMNSGYTIFMK